MALELRVTGWTILATTLAAYWSPAFYCIYCFGVNIVTVAMQGSLVGARPHTSERRPLVSPQQ